ncbi:MAG TPA: hypothetical protein VLU38_02465 [Methanomassiliicoccales archaeon]|nr:hypothetical protein [Methanomassiliicoccales archaeon]
MSYNWFKIEDGVASASWKEWKACAKDREDLKASSALGIKVFQVCMGPQVPPMPRHAKALIEAFAHALHHGFDEVDGKTVRELVSSFEGSGVLVEPRFWEDPRHRLAQQLALNGMPQRGGGLARVELLALEDDLDHNVRLNLLRLAWILELGAGMGSPYSKSQSDDWRSPRKISDALSEISQLLDEGLPEFLDAKETKALRRLISDLRKLGAPTLGPEALVNLSQRSDIGMSSDGRPVLLSAAFKAGDIDAKDARAWRRSCFLYGSLLIALKVMMLAHVSGEVGGLRPTSALL